MLANRDLPNPSPIFFNKEGLYLGLYLALSAVKPIEFERRYYASAILHWIYHEIPAFFSYLQKMNLFLPLNEQFAETFFFIYTPLPDVLQVFSS